MFDKYKATACHLLRWRTDMILNPNWISTFEQFLSPGFSELADWKKVKAIRIDRFRADRYNKSNALFDFTIKNESNGALLFGFSSNSESLIEKVDLEISNVRYVNICSKSGCVLFLDMAILVEI